MCAMPFNSLESIWEHVSNYGKSGECWEWQGYRSEQGYGRITIAYKDRTVHRIAYELTKGAIPEGMFVCHSCDNPPCCNPEHLWLGTCLDNQRDCAAKGRKVSGDDHYSRKHPEKLARGDRNGARLHPEKLARGERHGSRTHPEKIIKGDDWLRVHTESRKGEHNGRAKLTEVQVGTILLLYEKGFKQKDIAELFNTCQAVVSKICIGDSWKHIYEEYKQNGLINKD